MDSPQSEPEYPPIRQAVKHNIVGNTDMLARRKLTLLDCCFLTLGTTPAFHFTIRTNSCELQNLPLNKGTLTVLEFKI